MLGTDYNMITNCWQYPQIDTMNHEICKYNKNIAKPRGNPGTES